MRRRGMGDDEVRKVFVNIRVSEADQAAFRTAAARDGFTSVGAWMRETALDRVELQRQADAEGPVDLAGAYRGALALCVQEGREGVKQSAAMAVDAEL